MQIAMNRRLYAWPVAGVVMLLAGCASIPEPLVGDFAAFQPDQATERSLGAQVRWGGAIVQTLPGPNDTCVEILAHTLDRELRPVRGDQHHGRFLACREGFQDPAIFTAGRDITVVGRIEDFVDGEIGEFVYRYPRISAEVMYLWAIRPDMVFVSGSPFHDPWWPYRDPWWQHRYPRHRWSGSVIIIR